MDSCDADDTRVNVSYHLNRLQGIEAERDYLVTLNPGTRVDPDQVISRMTLRRIPPTHRNRWPPQSRLAELNSYRTAFAGAWQGWGFHEDGCASGVRAAAHFGVDW